jgi:membrane-bound lytic murein transglycosylase D
MLPVRVHTATPQSTERKIIHTLLVACLALGFISIIGVYLPQRLAKLGTQNPLNQPPRPKLHTVIPKVPETKGTQDQRATHQGPLFRFTPEAEPTPPEVPMIAQQQARTEDSLATDLVEELDTLLYETKPKHITHETSSLVDGSATRPTSVGKQWWKTPVGLEVDVGFWRDIYTKYPSSEVVLHDIDHLEIIYDVIDLSKIDNNPILTDEQKRSRRKEKVKAERERVKAMLKRLSQNYESALRTKLGRKIARLYATVDEPAKFKEAYKRGVRSQTGLKNKFEQALMTSGKYLGEIEMIFKSYGLPRELTRLVFVESMFQVNARSKVGAAGIWQFMPGTGRKYLRINRFVDERLDPILATHAAAKLLKHNYEHLGSWPLAINAYNAGRGRLAQAVKRLGTRDIGTIIKRFDHPKYGFASRNFFLEFVAAREIADNAEHYFGRIEYEQPLSYDVMELPFHISLPEVAKMSDVSIEEIYELNPAIEDRTLIGKVVLPMGSTLRVPEKKGDKFLTMAQRASHTSRAPLKHVVARGESLVQIARMYGVPAYRIREANPSLRKKPRRGQKLYIPFD